MEANRPGDVLAGRYRLADLLSESRGGRFWLAQDLVLGRPVALHVIPSSDDRAELLLDAAKESAAVADQHLLRVLDAARVPDAVYVVNEWGAGTSTDHLLAEHGPLSPRRAAWITAEVADCLAAGHAGGHAHGRLNPENVLLDAHGGVQVIGYAVDAALHGLRRSGSVAMDTDLLDLGGLLQALLTGRWAGVSDSHVPPVPRAHDRPLRPRQVRAGVPRVLDDLCGAILAAGPDDRPTASRVAATLREYVGDPSDLIGDPLQASVSGSGRQPLTPPEWPIPIAVVADAAPGDPAEATQVRSVRPEPLATPDADDGPPTEESAPVFDDDTNQTPAPMPPAGRPKPPPPPTTAPPPAKPLFADEPRRPRYDEEPETAERDDSWIFSSVPPSVVVSSAPWQEEDGVPGRSWLRLAIGLGLGLVVVVVAVALYRWLGDRSDTTTVVPPSTTPAPTQTVAPPVAIAHLGVRSYDPQGTGEEYPELTHYAVDGDPRTSWHTSTYFQQLGPHGLKEGVGLILSLHKQYDVTRVTLQVGGETSVSAYVSDSKPDPRSSPVGKPAASATGDGTITLPIHTQRGQYVIVWLTKLTPKPSGYEGIVDEVGVTGIPVT